MLMNGKRKIDATKETSYICIGSSQDNSASYSRRVNTEVIDLTQDSPPAPCNPSQRLLYGEGESKRRRTTNTVNNGVSRTSSARSSYMDTTRNPPRYHSKRYQLRRANERDARVDERSDREASSSRTSNCRAPSYDDDQGHYIITLNSYLTSRCMF
jgi:hypothetical protein